MDWNKGYEARYYANIVDAETWRDLDRFEVTGGSISRSALDLRESADIDTVNFTHKETWIRVWLDARQNGATDHVALFTGLAINPQDDIDGNTISNSLECYSVLKPCQDILLPRGWYANKGIRASIILEDLLSVTPAPVVIKGTTPRLTQYIIAEEGENHLTMVDKILTAINWRMRILGDGTIEIKVKPNTAKARLDALDNDGIEPVLTRSNDWYSCPNVLRAVMGDESVIVRDTSKGYLSIGKRGREVWAEETSCQLSEVESLTDYAKRRLKELQQVAESLHYSRRYNPDVLPTDWIELYYPRQGINGTYYVATQSIELGYGATTTEEVMR